MQAPSGSNIEAAMQDADIRLKELAVESVDPDVDPGVVEKRAALLLSFASASERLGNYTQQHERVMTARSILAPICERTKAPSCLNISASTHEAEGDYLLNVERKEDAIVAYAQALERRNHLRARGPITTTS